MKNNNNNKNNTVRSNAYEQLRNYEVYKNIS